MKSPQKLVSPGEFQTSLCLAEVVPSLLMIYICAKNPENRQIYKGDGKWLQQMNL